MRLVLFVMLTDSCIVAGPAFISAITGVYSINWKLTKTFGFATFLAGSVDGVLIVPHAIKLSELIET